MVLQLLVLLFIQIVGGQNETEQQMFQRTAKETVSPWQTQQPKFPLLRRSLFSVRVTQGTRLASA